jgi:hypothetical protein
VNRINHDVRKHIAVLYDWNTSGSMFTDLATLLLMGTAKVPKANADPKAAIHPQISQGLEGDIWRCCYGTQDSIISGTEKSDL